MPESVRASLGLLACGVHGKALCSDNLERILIAKTRRLLLLYGIGSFIILLDQYTKHWVRQSIPLGVSWSPIAWLDPIVTFTHVRNTGAAFGLLPQLSGIFIVVALVVIVGIIVYYRQLAQASLLLRIALGLQLGGAAGNLIDRLIFGHVTDFIDFRVWPVFNVADSAIVIGTALLGYYVLFAEQPVSDEVSNTVAAEAGVCDMLERIDGADYVEGR
jgi:signal peptidase II